MRKLKQVLVVILSVFLIITSTITFSATDTIDEYCGLDLDNYYLPNLPSVNKNNQGTLNRECLFVCCNISNQSLQ